MKRVIILKLISIFIFISFFMITCSRKEKEQDRRVSVVKKEKDDFSDENRLALVIGNSDYKVGPLSNPVNDARAIAEKLENLSFSVMLEENKTQDKMKKAILKFGKALKKSGGVGLFYFGGHGMQVKGKNYLIPVDSKFESEEDVEILAVDMGMVLNRMENAKNRVNIIILDACRDNPFIRSSRSGARGLAAIDAPGGTIIAYSTAPGSVAEDGAGENSTYTKYLLSNIGLPGLRIEDVFKNVRKKVIEDTQNRQVPWESSSLVGDFYFSYPISMTSQQKPQQKQEIETSLEITFWKSVEKSTNPEDFKDYLQRFPQGVFSGIAQRKLVALEAEISPPAKEQDENDWINWQTKFQNDVSKLKKIDMDNNISAQSKQNAWEKLLSNYSQDNPYRNEDEQLRTYANERIKYWKNEIKRISTVTVTRLRSSYMTLSRDDVASMLKRKGFFDFGWNESGSFNNNYQSRTINGDKVVIDHATGLMWHQSGSSGEMEYEKAEQWIRDLNDMGYAGYNDWRLPTVEEGASLLENSQQNGDLYINPVFSDRQTWMWTGDKFSELSAWVVYFDRGSVNIRSFYERKWITYIFVRPVRPGQ